MTVSAACTLSQSMKKTLDRRCWPYLAQIVIKVAFITTSASLSFRLDVLAEGPQPSPIREHQRLVKKINFISTTGRKPSQSGGMGGL